jgi:putative transposase
MARLPRLALAGQAHWLTQQAHGAVVAFQDAADRQLYLDALQDACRAEQVRLHAFALLSNEVHLLATPAFHAGLGRLMQAVGRRYVSAYHRRHGGSGTLWSGRFRCALVQAGPQLLDVLCLLDGLVSDLGHTSVAHRTTDRHLPLLTDPPEYWALGNTPFDRQARWRDRVAEGLPMARRQQLLASAKGSWVIGSAAFQQEVALATARPATPRPRGRPAAKPDTA